MIYGKWLLLAIVSFVVDILGIFIVAIALACGGVGFRLPVWAQWWDNDREPFGDAARGPAIRAASGLLCFWLRYCWLAWRNPSNNFGYLLGFRQLYDVDYSLRGDSETSDQGHPGWLFATATQNGALVAFEFYFVWEYKDYAIVLQAPYLVPVTKCVRVRLGWKIADNATNKIADGSKAQIVCVINPVMSFTQAG